MAINKPDLLKYNCRSLRIGFHFRIEEKEYRELVKLFGEKVLTHLLDISSYQITKKKIYNYVGFLLQKSRKRKQKQKQKDYFLEINIKYFPRAVGFHPIASKKAKKTKVPIFSIIDSLQNKQVRSNVRVEFIYPRQSYLSLIKLPIMLETDLFGENYAEVRGMRFALRSPEKEKKPKYTHIVELMQNNDIRHYLSFRRENKITPTILDDILQEAVNLSRRILKKGVK